MGCSPLSFLTLETKVLLLLGMLLVLHRFTWGGVLMVGDVFFIGATGLKGLDLCEL